jgi:hypothetical protein
MNMFQWLDRLQAGDNVLIRDYEPGPHRRNGFPPEEFVETVMEIDDEFIKTLPLGYKPGSKTIEPIRFFQRRFGDSNSQQLIRKVA